MKAIKNILIVLIIILLIGIFAVLGFSYFSKTNIDSLNTQLDSNNKELQKIQAENEQLQKQAESSYLEYKNASGRLAFLGAGTGKIAYLTFDDGPTYQYTPKILQTLKEKGACATWFCLANTKQYQYINLDILPEIEAAGSAVGIHDWDQDSSYSYYKGSVDNYFTSDFNKAKEAIEAKLNHEVKIMRFAGGSSTIGFYNKANKTALPIEVLNRGYQYFDWNVTGLDSSSELFVNGATPTQRIVQEVLNGAKKFAESNSPINILLHDTAGKSTTPDAVGPIIDGLKEMGYTFKVCDYDTPGFYQMALF
ncbi:MAG: polysaccharide deacetylase family protein [Coriobacteriales bacterium]|nr:polysaccharide deacetylase family protein [Coriobacteriales bacterium]